MITKIKNRIKKDKEKWTDLYLKNKKLVYSLIAIYVIKVIISGLFSSDYQNKMFMPFVSNFLNNITKNPYQSWYELNTGVNFPYQFIMLLIESTGMLIINVFNIKLIFLKNLFFKLPLLFFDLIGLIYLFKIFPRRKKEISILYSLSSIILYTSYMHSQLDIIPISILIASVYYLTTENQKKNILFSILLGLSIMTKHSIVIVVPILFVYLYKKDGLKETLQSILIMLFVILLFLIPFWSDGYIYNVLLNKDQNIIMNVFLEYGRVKIYVSILALFIVYFNSFVVGSINKDLLFGYCAICFSVFLVFIPPMPGWFVWIVPFMIPVLASQSVKNKEKVMIIYYIFSLMFLFYFIFCHNTGHTDLYFLNKSLSFLKINNKEIVNIIFTIFTATLVYVVYIIYKNGLESNTLYKRRSTPFTIGISGDSGSGKTTLVTYLNNMFKKEKILLIEGDGDHKWERNEKMWEKYTHLNPKANYLYRQARNIEELRNGRKVSRVDYDHDTGKFSKQYQIKQKRYIILNGLHTLYLPQLRENLDLKIYIDTDVTLKNFWKIRRDSTSRGYTVKQVLESIKKRETDYEKYVYPQIKYADLVITFYDKNLTEKQYGKDYEEKISIKFTLSSKIDLEPIVSQLEKYQVEATYDFSSDLEKQTINFDYDSFYDKDIPFDEILENVTLESNELSINKKKMKSNKEGLIKLIIVGMINQKLIERG